MRSLIRCFCLLLLVLFVSADVLPAADGKNAAAGARSIITEWVATDEDSVLFNVGTSMGMMIPAGQSLEFVVPESFRGRFPNFACIRHRKDPVFVADSKAAIDEDSAWLSVAFHDPQTGTWVTWRDQFGPEKRSATALSAKPKQNTLYNFPEYVGRFSPDRVRVSNRGSGNLSRAVASFHSLEITYLTGSERCAGGAKTLIDHYEKLNSLVVRYTLDEKEGVELKPGSGIELVLPDEFRGRDILHVVLKHRKDPIYAADSGNFDAFDPDAAYILCEARSSISRLWHRWADRSSFAKFSEVRTADNPENETLHNCLRTFGKIKPDRLRFTNVAAGNPQKAVASVHEVEIAFARPALPAIKLEHIFTPETAFSDDENGRPVPLLGGGPRLGGKFPGALLLGKSREQRLQKINALEESYRFAVCASLTAGTVTDQGNLLLPLPVNCRLEQIDLAIGDLDITSLEYNKDGYFGRSGQAQVSVVLVPAAGETRVLIDRNNVGMAGMITCGGPVEPYVTSPGDCLAINVVNDEAFLLGYRLILSERE